MNDTETQEIPRPDISATLRRPNPVFEGQNGFESDFHDEEIDDAHLHEALERHRLAQYILTQKDRPIPTIEEMKAYLEKPENSASVKEEIQALKEEHLEDLDRLYAAHAGEYTQEVLDLYYSKDDVLPASDLASQDPDNIEIYEKLDEYYEEFRQNHLFQSLWDTDYSVMRHTYLSRLLPLERKRRELEKEEEEAKRRRDAMFPMSAADFTTKPGDVQLRAARFLTADAAKQEKMLAEFGWAWRQVDPLKAEFASNDNFAAEIRAMIISEQEVRDPRRK